MAHVSAVRAARVHRASALGTEVAHEVVEQLGGESPAAARNVGEGEVGGAEPLTGLRAGRRRRVDALEEGCPRQERVRIPGMTRDGTAHGARGVEDVRVGRVTSLRGQGLRDVDQRMGGLQRSDLLVLAGRPAMGKTSLATNIAFNIAKAWRGERQEDGTIKTVDGGIVGFFSLEMSADQLATRIVAEQSSISSYKIRQGRITEGDFARLTDVAAQIEKLPLYIDQTGGISIAQLMARARRLKRQKGLDVLFIDYLQLLSGSAKAGQNRVQELTEITTSLKALAKELNVPIIALSQLSRQVESRDDKRPQLSDLRESGSIEQDADVVMFVYREEYYLKGKEPRPGTEEHNKWVMEMEAAHGLAELIIGKQRHGPTGTVALQFDADVTRFSDRADETHLPERLE